MSVDAPDLPDDLLDRLVRVLAPVGVPVAVEPLTGGLFGTTWRVRLADARDVVVKVTSTDPRRLLTYEHDTARAEALVLRLGADHPDLLLPRLLHLDTSGDVLDGDVLVTAFVEGTLAEQADLAGPDDPRAARYSSDLGRCLARLHRVQGPAFGPVHAVHVRGGDDDPPARRLHGATWPEAFGAMVGAALDDGVRWGVALPAADVRDALARHHDALAHVRRPVLAHADLRPGNVLVEPASGAVVALLDPERAVWAEPLYDLVATDQDGVHDVPTGVLAGYAAQAGAAPDLDRPDAQARLWLYRLLFGLLLHVEPEPRGYEGPEADAFRHRTHTQITTSLSSLADL
ncbi:phosphotransferase family protein [Cellulomonas sp. S1-8]|uniref:phosphotransferase family protein n=1 Tax=Cellulomonas sp. S1-8 TaxID=2904790 RepID=UPI002244501C|nr:phosphotransferase [Cellulomonas sp. S1-8]UZN02948.1 phosphotransferase [Cellulomonas sp. S1-8]